MYYEYFVAFLTAFIVGFFSTPIAKKLAMKWNAVDVPKDERRMHKRPIPRLGGLAIMAGFAIGLFFYVVGTGVNLTQEISGISMVFVGLALLLMVGCGIWDDTKGIRPFVKLTLQFLAAFLVVVFADIRIINVTNPFVPEGMITLPDSLSILVSILWLVGITNAINLIDGLDGLAAGVCAISSGSLFLVALISGNYLTAGLPLILAGASLGFLPYNFNPAKIFMGDTGSLFLGFILGVISIQGTLKSYAFISIMIPLVALGLPLFDTTFAILRRILKRKPIMQADRGHLHHRLVDMGLSQRESVLVLYTVSAILGLGAIVFVNKGLFVAVTMVVSMFVFVVLGARYMGELREVDLGDDLPKLNQVNPLEEGISAQSNQEESWEEVDALKIEETTTRKKELSYK